jgi:hypothetical protein
MGNPVFERGFDLFLVNVLRGGEGSLIVAIRVSAINPLRAGMIIGCASFAIANIRRYKPNAQKLAER